MPRLLPFAAIRPPRALAALVSTRSYMTYSEEELAQKLDTNPYSLLHVLHRRLDGPMGGVNKANRFSPVRQGYEAFLEEGHLEADPQAQLYIYEQQWDGNTFTGVIGLISLDDYREGMIVKHENTIAKREKLFARYLRTVGFHAEPVLLARPEHSGWDQLMADICKKRPETEFATADGAVHRLWIVSEEASESLQGMAEQIPSFYVADGHHRLASSSLLDETDGVMAYILSPSQMRIAPFHRFVQNKLGVDWKTPLSASPLDGRPNGLPKTGLYALDRSGWWHIPAANLSFPESSWVYSHILAPIWKVEDERSDARVRYEPGTMPLVELELNRKEHEVVFILPAPDWAHVTQEADAGRSLPPKSTYIEPKLRSGITLYAWK